MIQEMKRDGYTPGNFPERFEADGIIVEYADLGEIQMGSPLVGRLSVNHIQLTGRFGGPPLLSKTAVYVPRYLDGERKFELCRISPETRQVTPILSPQHVIGLVKIEGNTLYFHRDVYRNSLSELNLITGKAVLAEIIRSREPFSWRRAGEKLWGGLTVPFVFLYIICIAVVTIPYIICRAVLDSINRKDG